MQQKTSFSRGIYEDMNFLCIYIYQHKSLAHVLRGQHCPYAFQGVLCSLLCPTHLSLLVPLQLLALEVPTFVRFAKVVRCQTGLDPVDFVGVRQLPSHLPWLVDLSEAMIVQLTLILKCSATSTACGTTSVTFTVARVASCSSNCLGS